MAWLKKQQPIQLYQASELPYVILKNSVKLCFDNCYGIKKDHNDHAIHFQVSSNNLRRINTNFYRFTKFPYSVPLQDIIYLDSSIVEGRIIKHSISNSSNQKNIAIIKSSYIRNISDEKLNDLNDHLDEFDSCFVLVGETIDPQVRLFAGVSNIVHHRNWYRTAVTIANEMEEKSDRKYCWTHGIPGLDISCFGMSDPDEIQEIGTAFNTIEVPEVSIDWVN